MSKANTLRGCFLVDRDQGLHELARTGKVNFGKLTDVAANDLKKAICEYVEARADAPGAIVLCRVRVLGGLRLSDVLGRREGSIGCLFVACEFTSWLVLDGAVLRYLDLRKCRVGAVRASHLHVLNDVRLVTISPADCSAPATFFLANSCVEGSVRVSGRNALQASPGDETTRATLDLAGARIAGDFRMVGSAIRIEKADDSRIESSAACSKVEEHIDCKGGVSLQNASVGGTVVFSDVRIWPNAKGKYAIDASGAKIGHALSVSRCELGGTFTMRYCDVGTYVDFHSLAVEPRLDHDSSEKAGAVDASVTRIGGDFTLAGKCHFLGDFKLRGAHIGESAWFISFKLTRTAALKPGPETEQPFALEAADVQIGGSLIFGEADEDLPTRLEAWSTAPDSSASAECAHVLGGIRLDRATIAGDFSIKPLLNFEWVDLPAWRLAAMADAAC